MGSFPRSKTFVNEIASGTQSITDMKSLRSLICTTAFTKKKKMCTESLGQKQNNKLP